MKRFQRFLILVILLGIVAFTYGLELRDKYVVPIIMYHDIVKNEDKDAANTVTEQSLDYQMAFLKKHRYHVISLDELAMAIRHKKALPHNTVVITLDDGHHNNYEIAFPVFKRYGFPATIFILPSQIGKKDYLTWDQIKEMEKAGISFGSHSLSHPFLPDMSDGRQKKEIYMSKKLIERRLGHRINHFCYPAGGFTDRIKEHVRKAGYLSACTTNRGYNRFNRDVYELKRVRFSDKSKTSFVLWAQLSGYYNLFRKPVAPH